MGMLCCRRPFPSTSAFGILCLLLALPRLFLTRVGAYEPLDPGGNVTIVWDIYTPAPSTPPSSYTVNVSIINLQQFRPIANWSLSWTWQQKELILNARGAEATLQGDCRLIEAINHTKPYCCLKTPTMVDLAKTDTPPVPGCCKGGSISSLSSIGSSQNSGPSVAVFQIDVGNATLTRGLYPVPTGFSLGVPGYTCTDAFPVALQNHSSPGSRYVAMSDQTFNVVCSYRKPRVEPTSCCVSFSSFYSPDVIPCQNCACACGAFSPSSSICLSGANPGTQSPFISDGYDNKTLTNETNSLVCSTDGCPVHIRFHLKNNYEGYWRAKVTVFNRMFQKTYADWNLLMEHPNMGNLTDVLSFNSSFLQPYGINNTASFYGIPYYNSWLQSASLKTGPGVVQSEMLFGKGADFTFDGGWPFPRKIVFGGSECVMPREYPKLPHSSSERVRLASKWLISFLVTIAYVLMV